MRGLNRMHSRSAAAAAASAGGSSRNRNKIPSSNSPVAGPSSSLRFVSSSNVTTSAFGNNISGGSIAFSSAPVSVADRCSFGSDRDVALFPSGTYYSLLNLAARPDPDPHQATPLRHKDNEAKEEEQELEFEEGRLDPSPHSFSDALKECKSRRLRSESHSFPKRKNQNHHRPSSLDFNGHSTDATIISPRFLLGGLNAMKEGGYVATSRSKTSNFTSPGTPNYRYHKGWSSERVPLPMNSNRRHMAGGAVLPFNNGRVIPSKWEDAEKWIFSPAGSENVGRSSVPPHHHMLPKAKSGPLGPRAYLSSSSAASPLNPCFDSGRAGGFSGSSPFLAGVFAADEGSCGRGSSGRGGDGGVGGGGGGGARSSSANAEPYILRSASVHGWSDAMIESCSSLPSLQDTAQDEKMDRSGKGGPVLSSAVLRKDVATQMSPDGSTQSSPNEKQSFYPSPSAHPIEELQSHLSKLKVRDVQVDDRVTVTRWSKKQVARGSDRRSLNIIEWKKKTVDAKADSCRWEVADSAECISKYKREEAKITAWENLQKAKSEAAIRKLEMKLEKKRSSSMDKILGKLRSAQRKAQEMRSAVATVQSQQVTNSIRRRGLYFRKSGQMSSLSGCFTCPAF